MYRNIKQNPVVFEPFAFPFIKWAGGKRALIPEIAKRFPARVNSYFEPFVGGGAVFFSFANQIEHAILSDSNKELICTYKVVKNNVNELIKLLKEHQRKHKKDTYFNEIRNSLPKDNVEVAARFIYLNKTCFNGLYRVNKSGFFNVPKGSYKNPDICNVEKLLLASKALANATIKYGDFAKTVKPEKSDFVYCDPPYDDCFTQYQPGGFVDSDQSRLKDEIIKWKKSGAKVLVSNSDTELIRSLYGDKRRFKISIVKAPRNINCNGNGRAPVGELLVSTYD